MTVSTIDQLAALLDEFLKQAREAGLTEVAHAVHYAQAARNSLDPMRTKARAAEAKEK